MIRTLLIVMAKELRETLRDRRTFLSSVVTGPLLALATALSYAGRHDEAALAFDRAVEVADGEWPRAFAMLARTLNRAYVHGFEPSEVTCCVPIGIHTSA